MPVIGWIFILGAFGLVLGSLLMLRDTSNSMSLSEEELEKVRKRKAELDAQEEDW